MSDLFETVTINTVWINNYFYVTLHNAIDIVKDLAIKNKVTPDVFDYQWIYDNYYVSIDALINTILRIKHKSEYCDSTSTTTIQEDPEDQEDNVKIIERDDDSTDSQEDNVKIIERDDDSDRA